MFEEDLLNDLTEKYGTRLDYEIDRASKFYSQFPPHMYKIFDDYNLDRGIIESNYQYTSNKTLKDILCEYENYFTEDKNIKSFIENLDNRTAKIYKK